MRTTHLVCMALVLVMSGPPPRAQSAGDLKSMAPGGAWDQALVGRLIGEARQARQQGDLMAAEKLCYSAFRIVDETALAAYDAYASRLAAEDRADAVTVRERSDRLHAVKAAQASGSQPSSTYLGFSPAEGINAYADLLANLQQSDEAERMRSLARAYQQVQQAHFQRTMMYRQGQDPRGSC